MTKKALITGITGQDGSYLAELLLAKGYEVHGIVRRSSVGNTVRLDHLLGDGGGLVLHYGDLTDSGRLAQLCGEVRPDEIYNLACPASPVHYQHNPVETLKSSVLGMMNMLDLALKTKAKVLHTSTSEVYGDPLVHPQAESYWGNVNTIGVRSCYDEGKRCAETLAADYRRAHGVDVRLVRIFNTYGPNMHPEDGRVISNFILQALRNEDITIYGDGSQTRSFQYCDDLVEAMRRYMELPREKVDAFFAAKGLGAPVLNTGNPGEYTIRELAEETLRQLPESKSKLESRPLPADDPRRRRPDISLAKELLGWEPKVPLVEGLAKTIEYFRAREKSAAGR